MSDEQEIEPRDDRLAADLRAIGRSRMMVPPSADDAIFAAARTRLARRRRTRTATACAVAAAVVLAVGLAALLTVARPPFDHAHGGPERTSNGPPAAAPAVTPAVSMDVNGDGRVDILDAFSLARKIEGRERLSLKWDINGDGVVDEKDVQAIAMSAVQLARR